jgi:hypothetical protein
MIPKFLLIMLCLFVGMLSRKIKTKIIRIVRRVNLPSRSMPIEASNKIELKKYVVDLPQESTISLLVKPLYLKNYPGTCYFESHVELNNQAESELPNRIDSNKILDWNDEDLKDYRISYYFQYQQLPPTMNAPILAGGMTRTDSMENANLIWGGVPEDEEIRIMITNLNKYQRYNHFPITWEFGSKDLLWRNYEIMKKRFPMDFKYTPESFVYPEEKKLFLATFFEDSRAIWLKKPRANCSGDGIEIVTNINLGSIPQDSLISRYIDNPHLINNKKYDLRLYVLVTSFTPIKIYLFPEGLVRFATDDYTSIKEKKFNKFIHLTNWSVNKDSSNFDNDNINDQDECRGSMWSVGALRKHFKSENLNFDEVWEKIKDIVAKTTISVVDKSIDVIKSMTTHSNNLFELYGYDILIDDKLQPWLLEVNTMPSLEVVTSLDVKVKTPLIADLLNILGFVPFSKTNPQNPKLLFQEEE